MQAKKVKIALVALLAACAIDVLHAADSGPDAVAKTRQSLRDKGFKTDLADFDFTTTAELQKREAILDLSSGFVRGRKPATPRPPPPQPPWQSRPPDVDLSTSLGNDAAIVVWKQEHLPADHSEQTADAWPKVRSWLEADRSSLDAKCAAILSGPIRIDLDASAGHSLLLAHLASLKELEKRLDLRVIVGLHDQHLDSAWTNLLAATRLATAWEPEPLVISHLVRFGITRMAFDATWQALQTIGWSDERLARLQSEWESVDYFKNLPETAAYARACAADLCERIRNEPSGLTMNELIREPKLTADAYLTHLKNRSSRRSGTYDDEKALLLHYRDREVELRNAVQCTSWFQMRQLPGITNAPRFSSTNSSPIQSMLNLRMLGVAMQHGGVGFLGRAAEAEAERRIIITAIALARFQVRHGEYPKSLVGLSPDLLIKPLPDFIDGQPLRYRLANDGHFVLYSISTDGIDDGGVYARLSLRDLPRPAPDENDAASPARKLSDLVWPRPASAADVAAFEQQKEAALAKMASEMEERRAAFQWDHAERRQQHAEKLVEQNPPAVTNVVVYHGRPLANFLCNRNISGSNKLSLAEMLTLRQVITGDEPEVVTFEAPIAFDSLTNLGELQLFVDPVDDPDYPGDEGCYAVVSACKRATNGSCLIAWSTSYECPGMHALQLGLELNEPDESTGEIFGPLLAVTVSNLCQFSAASANYDLETGATFHAKLPEQSASYVIDMSDTNGVHLKTISGSTTNGVIKEHWDLVDERGARFTNGVFNCLFDLTLPESGRRQKLRL